MANECICVTRGGPEGCGLCNETGSRGQTASTDGPAEGGAVAWRPFNVNERIRVKLNAAGRAIHQTYWEPFSGGKYRLPAKDKDGWSEFQMWDFMAIFGPRISMGAAPPFETGIQFETRPAPIEPVSNPYKFADEIAWLREAARYFAARSTGGEDRAHWANVYNAENANKLADRLALLSSNTGEG